MRSNDLTLLLVMPPQVGLLGGFATGLSSIANFIKPRLDSVQVQLLDLSNDSVTSLHSIILRKGIRFAKNTIVGITTTTASYRAALAVATAFKNLCKRRLKSAAGVTWVTRLGTASCGIFDNMKHVRRYGKLD